MTLHDFDILFGVPRRDLKAPSTDAHLEARAAPTVVVYLDVDADGNDLLDSAGNNVPAGWYVYQFPLSGDPVGGPYDTKEAAHRDVPRAPFGNGPCIVSLDCPPCTIKWQRA